MSKRNRKNLAVEYYQYIKLSLHALIMSARFCFFLFTFLKKKGKEKINPKPMQIKGWWRGKEYTDKLLIILQEILPGFRFLLHPLH